MLILSRRAAERIYLGDDIVLTIVAVGADKVRIGVKAPAGVRILRTELDSDVQIVMESSVVNAEALEVEGPATKTETPTSPAQVQHHVESDDVATLPFVPNNLPQELTDPGNIRRVAKSSKASAVPADEPRTCPVQSGLAGFVRTRRAA